MNSLRQETIRTLYQIEELPEYDQLCDLFQADSDGMVQLPELGKYYPPPESPHHMQYPAIYSVHNALIAPGSSFEDARAENKSAGIVLTSRQGIFSESFQRGIYRPLTFQKRSPNNWMGLSLPSPSSRLDGSYIWLDHIAAQFGHALVDSAACLWALSILEAQLGPREKMQFLGFSSHGTHEAQAEWPRYLKAIFRGAGISPGQIRIISEFTQVEKLILPRRISPLPGGGRLDGKLYNQTIASIGDRLLLQDKHGPAPAKQRNGYLHSLFRTLRQHSGSWPGHKKPSERRLFLSRSKLHSSRPRRADPDIEKALDDLFSDAGFRIFHPQLHSMPDQIRAIREAEYIAGQIGSALHLAAFSLRPVRMLRLVPSFFQSRIDHNILTPIGGQVTDLILPAEPTPGKPQHEMDWPLSKSDLRAVEKKLYCWLHS